jgi:hypothetical protein
MSNTTEQEAVLYPPMPEPDELTRFFWDGVEEHRLMIQRCDDCGFYLPSEGRLPQLPGAPYGTGAAGAQLYDGFTVITFQWLEGLGICGPGEAAGFIEEGNTRLGGSLPVNTDGGACNMGRRHGANFCIESVQQIRGECGPRQIPDCEVAVWSNAVGVFGGAVLLTA